MQMLQGSNGSSAMGGLPSPRGHQVCGQCACSSFHTKRPGHTFPIAQVLRENGELINAVVENMNAGRMREAVM